MSDTGKSFSEVRDIVKRLRSITGDSETEFLKSISHSGAVHESAKRIRPERPRDRRTSKADSNNSDEEYSHSRHLIPPKVDSRSRDSSRRSYHHSQRDSSRSRDSSRRSDHQSKRDSSKSKESGRIGDYDSGAGPYKSRDSSHKRDSSRSNPSSRRSHSRSRRDSSKSRGTSDRSKSRSRPESSSKKSYASLRKCVDKRSSAKDCFDFFILTCYFPKAAALSAQNMGNKEYYEDKLKDDWSIHGLWAFSYKYGAELEKECGNLINMWFDEKLLLDNEDFVKELREKWFNIYKKDGYSDETFWKHEFYEHGKCATRSKHVKDLKGYFNLALKLFNNADLKNTLADGGFEPGKIVTWAEMYNIIKKKHGGYPKIEQLRDPETHILIRILNA
ncbi:GSCOCG00004421001-RA-CDS [Cotesia congregata]|nr:GSCOCG00004421001-RA-CDS [Cotesia congregata]